VAEHCFSRVCSFYKHRYQGISCNLSVIQGLLKGTELKISLSEALSAPDTFVGIQPIE